MVLNLKYLFWFQYFLHLFKETMDVSFQFFKFLSLQNRDFLINFHFLVYLFIWKNSFYLIKTTKLISMSSALNIYELLIFNGKEKLLFYEDLKKPNLAPQTEIIAGLDKTQVHRVEDISGIAEATKCLVEKLSPHQSWLLSISQNRYKYNIFELPTGLKFILITRARYKCLIFIL